MPDPLCRVHGFSVLLGREQNSNPTPGRVLAPGELDALRVALGRAVRQFRAVAGVSQECLGFSSDLHRNYIGAIERGQINPTLRVLGKLAYGLRVPPSDLLVIAERLAAEQRRTARGGDRR